MEYVELILPDGTIVREPCRRSSGSLRKYFSSREEAEKFASDPQNHGYHGDVAHVCDKCGWWHLSHPEWLVYSPVPGTLN